MKKRVAFLSFVIFFCVLLVFSEEIDIRVTAPKANIRVLPSIQSNIIRSVPMGAVLQAQKKEGPWFFVSFVMEGFTIKGYIHETVVAVEQKDERTLKAPSALITTEARNAHDKVVADTRVSEKPVTPLTNSVLANNSELSESEKALAVKEPTYLNWKTRYNLADRRYKKAGKMIKYSILGMGVGYIGAPLAAVLLLKSSSSAGGSKSGNTVMGIGLGIGAISSGLLIYGLIDKAKKGNAREEVYREGQLKKFLSAGIDPFQNRYCMTLTLQF